MEEKQASGAYEAEQQSQGLVQGLSAHAVHPVAATSESKYPVTTKTYTSCEPDLKALLKVLALVATVATERVSTAGSVRTACVTGLRMYTTCTTKNNGHEWPYN